MVKSKKSKKNKNKVIPPEQLEGVARDNLQKCHYRKAKECFKELCLHNKEKYLPELIESYHGLANQMIDNGQTTEAQTVLDHIKTLDPAFNKSTLETQINIKRSDNATAANKYIDYLISGNDDLDNTELFKAADMLVMSFKDYQNLASGRPDLHNDLNAIRDGLELISSENFDDALNSIRNVKKKSIFSHWKLYLKGLIFFYRNDDTKANHAFRMLPHNTVLHKAAEPLLLIMDKDTFYKENNSETRKIYKRACTLTEWPKLSDYIVRADNLWKTGRYQDSFQHLFDKLKGFPAEGSGLTANLTRFYYNAPFSLPKEIAEKYITYLCGSNNDRIYDHDIAMLLAFRVDALVCEPRASDYTLIELWGDYLTQYDKVHKNNIKLEALIYARLGLMFSLVEESSDNIFSYFFGAEKQLRNSELAIKFLEKSITLNKKDKEVYINLLKVYEQTKEKSKTNQLLDTMIKHFPEDKDIFFNAGTACINRGVYFKGVKYLEMALKLDNLDHTIKERLAIGYIEIAKINFKKNKAPAARNSLQKSIELGSPESFDFNRGQACLYARWAALEFAYGSREVGQQNITKLLSFNIQRFPLQYFTILIFKAYKAPLSYINVLEKEVNDALKECSTAETVLQLHKTLFYIKQLGKFSWLNNEKTRINSFSIRAARNKNDKCTRQLAKEIVQIVISDQVKSLYNNKDYSVAIAYIKRMLEIDKYDPRFLFYAYLIKFLSFKPQRGKKEKKFLKSILLLAERRKETELMKEIKREIDSVEKLLINPFLGGNVSDVISDEDITDNELFSTIDNYYLKALVKIVSDTKIVSKKKAKNKNPKRNPKHEQLEFFQDFDF